MKELLINLDLINKQIASLRLQKEDLERLILEGIPQQPHEGQRTYEFGEYKVTVKTAINYRIDKEKFLEMDLDDEINPVRVSTKYEINPVLMRRLKGEYGLLFSEFVTETPARPSIGVSYNV